MGAAIIKSLLSRGYSPEMILVSDPDERRLSELKELGVRIFTDNQEMVSKAECILLAVKPQAVDEVFKGLELPAKTLLLSIVAGVSTKRLEEYFPGGRVIRAMPNTPGLIRQGITAISPGAHTGEEELRWAKEILESLGEVVIVPEKLMDAVTALSGSGPGFVYTFIEALIDAGVWVGLPRQLAGELAVRTVIGSAEMVAHSHQHPGVLRDMVTSPGGTTINGLARLEEGGFRGLVMKAVLAAAERSRDLGDSNR